MNERLQKIARDQILIGLKQLPVKTQNVFKRMYSHENPNASIEDVVDMIDSDKLDWAMKVVDRTVYKNKYQLNKEK